MTIAAGGCVAFESVPETFASLVRARTYCSLPLSHRVRLRASARDRLVMRGVSVIGNDTLRPGPQSRDETDRLREQAGHALFCESPTCRACCLLCEAIFMEAMRGWEVAVEGAVTAEIRERIGPAATGDDSFGGDEAVMLLRRTAYDFVSKEVTLLPEPKDYILLHEPDLIVAVTRHWVSESKVATAVTSLAEPIQRLVSLRHALAHGTDHARILALEVQSYYRPEREYGSVGEFLRSQSEAGRLMLDVLLDELQGLRQSLPGQSSSRCITSDASQTGRPS